MARLFDLPYVRADAGTVRQSMDAPAIRRPAAHRPSRGGPGVRRAVPACRRASPRAGPEGDPQRLVASAVAAEGKTLSATNLALVLSRFEKRVLLVDGDLRKPSVHRLLAIENSTGLSDILKRPGGRFTAQILSPTLSVITGGHADPDPVALLVSDAAGQFIAQAREHFDWVVVDTPPIMLFPDAGVFADRLDTCVMVVSAATTASPVAVTAVEAVGASRILGVVLNRAEPSEIAAGYDYGQYRTRGRRSARAFRFWRSRRI
jgi:capsular exopolysaccharide synthesis family protein